MNELSDTDFTVRIRFRIPNDRLGIDQHEVVYTPTTGPNITLKSDDVAQPIRGSPWLVILSSGWVSEEGAEAGADAITDALRRALACHIMGADLGTRVPQGRFFKSGLRMLEKSVGRPMVEDIHGRAIFPTALHPMFARVGAASLYRTVQEERWKQTLLKAVDLGTPMTTRERAAFDLYSCAHSVRQFVDARFVLLFAAIETLLEDSPRPDSTIRHVNELIELTESAALEASEKASLLGSLRWLRSHSIRTAGRAFVQKRLAGRTYGASSAEEVFLACYDLRNRLLHGQQPFPTRMEVSGQTGALEHVVSQLLAGAVLDHPDEQRPEGPA
jgi:hypothetical protein